MIKKLSASLVPLLAIAFAMLPVAARAAPHWYSNGKLIKEGEVVPLTTTSNALKFHVSGSDYDIKLQCALRDQETITNPTGGGPGTEEVTEFALSGCSGTNKPERVTEPLCPAGVEPEVITEGLPWLSRLIPGPPIRDEIVAGPGVSGEAIVLAPRCLVLGNYQYFDLFSGILIPTVGNSVLTFGTAVELRDIHEHIVTVTGKDKLKGPPGDQKITAQDP